MMLPRGRGDLLGQPLGAERSRTTMGQQGGGVTAENNRGCQERKCQENRSKNK